MTDTQKCIINILNESVMTLYPFIIFILRWSISTEEWRGHDRFILSFVGTT